MKRLLIMGFTGLLLSSCVSLKVHKDLQEKYNLLAKEADQLRISSETRQAENAEMTQLLAKTRDAKTKLIGDTVRMHNNLRELQTRYDRLSRQYDFLVDNNSALMAASASESKALMEQMNALQARLQAKEDSLNTERIALEKGRARVNELEGVIRRKDSTAAYVRQRVADALLGFSGKGLTVNMKDGKVYVSLENSLLFAPGSWEVAAQGKVALQNLAGVLAANPDISVLVEGHTDNDPFRGRNGVQDNWDLSVMRATSVVRIITSAPGMDASRVTAAGRGEFVPLVDNDTPENKATNRRTEIILTPDLSELAALLEGS